MIKELSQNLGFVTLVVGVLFIVLFAACLLRGKLGV